jgi:diguanylate cyclase (GGDEF)-like protein
MPLLLETADEERLHKALLPDHFQAAYTGDEGSHLKKLLVSIRQYVLSGDVSMGRSYKVAAYTLLIAMLPLIQLVALSLSRNKAEFYSYYFTLGAASLACAVCFRYVFSANYPRAPMLALAISLGIWALGLLSATVQVTLLDRINTNTNYTYLLFVSYGLPLLYAATAYGDPYSSRIQKIVDGFLLILLFLLYYVSIQDVLDVHGELTRSSQWFVTFALDLENIFLCAAYLFRWLTSSSGQMRRYFKITSLFLVMYAACIALHNHFESNSDLLLLQFLGQALAPLPFTALIALVHHYASAPITDRKGSPLSQRLALSVSPAILLSAIFVLSFSIYTRHSPLGLIVAGLAMAAYVVRTAQSQYWFVDSQAKLQEQARGLERLSYTDTTTGIPNRRAFDELFAREWAVSQREEHSISVLMVDVDRFKQYNDVYGHSAGDLCLRTVARLLAGSLRRPSDFIGRYGGEEFVVLLPATPMEGAEIVANRMNRAIYDADLLHIQGIGGRITVSIGVASKGQRDDVAKALLDRADANLYYAKSQGRNQFWTG